MSQESETHSYLLAGFSTVSVFCPPCVIFPLGGVPRVHTRLLAIVNSTHLFESLFSTLRSI